MSYCIVWTPVVALFGAGTLRWWSPFAGDSPISDITRHYNRQFPAWSCFHCESSHIRWKQRLSLPCRLVALWVLEAVLRLAVSACHMANNHGSMWKLPLAFQIQVPSLWQNRVWFDTDLGQDLHRELSKNGAHNEGLVILGIVHTYRGDLISRLVTEISRP
jgi:hypothetical protein